MSAKKHKRGASSRTALSTRRHQPDCAGHSRPSRHRRRLGLRLLSFAVISLFVVGSAAWLLRPRGEPGGSADARVTITMAGFEPERIEIKAGQPTSVMLINPDSPFHSDGGGVHQFAIPGLGVDAKVQPRSSALITVQASTPGTYEFYCDTCCGGKENPSMRGKLVVS